MQKQRASEDFLFNASNKNAMKHAFGLPSILPEPRASSGLARSHGVEPSSVAAAVTRTVIFHDARKTLHRLLRAFWRPHPYCRSNGRNCALESATILFGVRNYFTCLSLNATAKRRRHAGATSLFCRWGGQEASGKLRSLGAKADSGGSTGEREGEGAKLSSSANRSLQRCLGQGEGKLSRTSQAT